MSFLPEKIRLKKIFLNQPSLSFFKGDLQVFYSL